MGINLSPEGVGAVFRMHGYNLDQQSDPIVYQVLRTVLEKNLIAEDVAFFQNAEATTPLEAFSLLRDYLVKKYGTQLDEEQLFKLIEIIEFLGEMVSPEGMGIPSDQVFAFLRQALADDTEQSPKD